MIKYSIIAGLTLGLVFGLSSLAETKVLKLSNKSVDIINQYDNISTTERDLRKVINEYEVK